MERLVYVVIGIQAVCVGVFIAGLAVGHAALNSGNGWEGAVAIIMLAASGLTLLRSSAVWSL